MLPLVADACRMPPTVPERSEGKGTPNIYVKDILMGHKISFTTTYAPLSAILTYRNQTNKQAPILKYLLTIEKHSTKRKKDKLYKPMLLTFLMVEETKTPEAEEEKPAEDKEKPEEEEAALEEKAEKLEETGK